ncbi:MAG: winged helix-turn-helix transcriptional regulator [Pseudooceanicola sp.]|nr:winged helix-turn-helix transcriptional regulator [Pseudooceanicola sp.]
MKDHLCPSRRLSQPVTTNPDGRRVIDIDSYAPYFLTAVNTALSRGASQLYLREFGIGVTEWRVMSWIATEPGIPASRVCEVIMLDKSAVSRSVARLDELGFLEAAASGNDPRRKMLSLSAAGLALHDRILERALSREARLIEGVEPEDLEAWLRVMRILRRNVERL